MVGEGLIMDLKEELTEKGDGILLQSMRIASPKEDLSEVDLYEYDTATLYP